MLSYGIFKKLTAEAELGYYFTKYQDSDVLDEFRTHGFTNATVSLKYALLKSNKDMELTLGAGSKFPVSRKVFRDEYGVPYPQEIQPSTGCFRLCGAVVLFQRL